MAPWDVGHEALRVAHLPVIAHPFTEHVDRARIGELAGFLFGDDLERDWERRFGHVALVWISAMDADDVAGHLGELGRPGLRGSRLMRSNWARLLFADGSAVQLASDGGSVTLGGFGRLRRIRTSPRMIDGTRSGGPPGPIHNDKIFLVVPGARLVGRCQAGSEIEASIVVQHPGAEPFRYAQMGHCSGQGRFELRVPYANTGMGHQLRAGPAWTLTANGEERWRARVSERDVQLSAEVTVSDFYADRP